MIDEPLDELACLYALGAMSAAERVKFEAALDSNADLRRRVDELLEIASALAVASAPNLRPAGDLRARMLRRIYPSPEQFGVLESIVGSSNDPMVLTDREGLVRWVNPAFVAMCGYELDEAIGRKPGAMLQGQLTDAATVMRLREAIRAGLPCCEEIINYRKNGEPYWVAVSITPILDVDRKPRSFVAIERELTGRAIAA